MRGLRFPLSGYALPAVAPCKKHERAQRTKQSVPGNPRCATNNHAAHHVASPRGCQLSKIQLLVLLKRRWRALHRARFADTISNATQPRLPLYVRRQDVPGGCPAFMSLLGWRSTTLMLFLARVTSGPEVTKEITGGEAGGQHAGWPTTSIENKYKGPRFYRRGKGGEGRERRQDRVRRFPYSFVQVFSGYIASLSKIFRQNDL